VSRHARIPALIALVALALVACGSRVEPLPQAGGFIGGPSTGPTQPSGVTDLVPTTGPTGITSTGPGTVLPSTTASPILPNCRGGATDTGVTSKTIKLGLIASLNGPLQGQFDSAVEAVDSHFRMINEAGGICGRSIQLVVRDDSGDGATNLRVAEQLATEEKVFAFVGSHSAPDDSGIAKTSAKYKIPDIGFPLTWERAENPYSYGVPGQLQRETIGIGASGSKYLNKVNGITQMAIFWLRESEVSILNAWAFESAMKQATHNKIEICHEQPSGVLDNNYTNYVVSMKGKCDAATTAVYSTMENNANIKLAIAMSDQNFHPKVFAPTFTSYQPKFITDANGATEGAYLAMPQVPFERLEQPLSAWTPGTYELKRYVDALNRFHPSHYPPGSFGAPAWGDAALFVQAAASCGARLTRPCLLRQLDTMGPFSANGLLVPTRPSDHHIYTADLIVQVRGGKFVEIRQDDKGGPPGGPDFWDVSALINWQKYYCENKSEFHNTAEKDKLITYRPC
jgi:ABC-type branched-subunit amino acid transport system substrate-binding protein